MFAKKRTSPRGAFQANNKPVRSIKIRNGLGMSDTHVLVTGVQGLKRHPVLFGRA